MQQAVANQPPPVTRLIALIQVNKARGHNTNSRGKELERVRRTPENGHRTVYTTLIARARS